MQTVSHLLIVVVVSYKKILGSFIKNFLAKNIRIFQILLRKEEWRNLYVGSETNDNKCGIINYTMLFSVHILGIILMKLFLTAVSRKIYNRNDEAWATSGIRVSSTWKRELHRLCRASCDDVFKSCVLYYKKFSENVLG